MASLTDKSPANTYKDLLTISSASANQGLETSSKQVFDGEGVGSPLWLSTNALEFKGPVTTTSNLTVGGNTVLDGNLQIGGLFNLVSPNDTVINVMSADNDGNVNVLVDFVTKKSVTFKSTSNELIMDAENTSFTKGANKGGMKLEDTEVKLQKGSTDLLTAKDDGTLRIQSVSSEPSSPSNGDIIIKDGILMVNN